jgi:transcriptional regulator with XRE-family HTH domain
MRESAVRQSPNIIGQYLKDKRRQAGLSQDTVAIKAGAHKSTISRIENGKWLPTVDVLVCISEALDVDLTELLALLGARTSRTLPDLEDYLRQKFDLPERVISQVSAYFQQVAQGMFDTPKVDK